MKSKLVLWGKDTDENQVLLAMELLAESNEVKIWTFAAPLATDELADILMNQWRNNKEVDFPEGFKMEQKELSVSETLLPDGITADRTDILQRAQTEWHFVVLSSKMSNMYRTELEDLKAKVSKLEKFDNNTWEELKTFWSKVQQQVRERNIFRDHAKELRKSTDELFSEMKQLRSKLDEEFRKTSENLMDKFMYALKEIEDKMEDSGTRLGQLFEDLKSLQKEFRKANMTREHRSKTWERLDAAFKAVKIKRFGPKAAKESSPLERIEHRYKGLLNAIEKISRSIKREKDDLNFQNKKIDTTDGQLEAQIRKAKILMIEERLRSKEEKLKDMYDTKSKLEDRIKIQRKKEEQRKKQKEVEAAKAAAAKKIKEEIKQAAEERIGDDKIEKAADAIASTEKSAKKTTRSTKKKTTAKKENSIRAAVGQTLGESLEDVVDTVKAVALVIGERIEEGIEDIKENLEEVKKKA